MEGITKGKISRPVFIVIHGGDGVGKSTFAADAPNPIFLGTEDGTANLDVARFDNIKSYQDIKNNVVRLIKEDHDFKTLALDSLDHIEPMLWQHVCKEAKADLIEDVGGGFGRGYTRANQLWTELVNDLKMLRDKKNMNIIAIAHSQVKTFNDPSQPLPYDRYVLKLNDKASALWRESADCVLFATFEVILKKENKNDRKAKAYGEDKRLIYTSRRPSFDAKNRYNLPFELPLSWDAFYSSLRGDNQVTSDQVIAELQSLMTQVNDDVKKRMEMAIEKASGDIVSLVKIRNHARVLTNQ